MNPAVKVAVVGFTTFERASFDTFFRLAPRRQPSYALAMEVAEAELVVVNGDRDEDLSELAATGRLLQTLSIGGAAPAGVAARLPRPINMKLVLQELDKLVLRRQALSPSMQRVLEDFASVTRGWDGSVDPRAEAAAYAAAQAPAKIAPLAEPIVGRPRVQDTQAMPLTERPRRPGLDRILVVDRDDQALRAMTLHLERLGYQVSLARSGSDAMERVARRHYEFVFLEAELADIDGYLACQAIKRHAVSGHRPPPTVVMMTRRADALDLARSGLAGSDACIAKPLREEDLLHVIGQRPARDHAFAETAAGPDSAL